MKVLIFAFTCLALFALVQSIEENDEYQMLTVYKTVTAPSYAGTADGIKNKKLTASSPIEQAKPTVSPKAEDEPIGENKSTENDKPTTPSSPIADMEIQLDPEEENEEEEEERDTNKPMRLAPEVLSDKDGTPDNGSSLESDMPSKPASHSGSSVASGSVSAFKVNKSLSSSSTYSSAFSFSPITLAPESTKAGGAKATALVMNNASAKTATVKTEKRISSALRVTPSINMCLFVVALILHCY